MANGIRTGNAEDLGREHRGWLLGHFIEEASAFHTRGVEVKWARHSSGERRDEWTSSNATTISILVSGRFALVFEDGERLLARPGDFAFWDPGVKHTWRAEKESVIATVRWPSGDVI